MDIKIDSLFPTPVGKLELPDSIRKDEFEYIKDLDTHKNESNATSINKYLFKEPELKRLGNICEQAANDFFQKVYAPKNVINLYITQSWANYTEEGEYHHKHSHANSLISGVLYIAADDTTDKISFFKDLTPTYYIPTDIFNMWNSDSWWYSVKPNSVILFPSYLAHMVLPKQTPNTRISISFNTFFKGTLGDPEVLNELIL